MTATPAQLAYLTANMGLQDFAWVEVALPCTRCRDIGSIPTPCPQPGDEPMIRCPACEGEARTRLECVRVRGEREALEPVK